MSETQQSPIVAVTAHRKKETEMPNRRMRRVQFTTISEALVTSEGKSGKVELMINNEDGSTLVRMPDGSGYYVSATLLINECITLWEQEQKLSKTNEPPVPDLAGNTK